jgi:signal transduction histidine kinase
VNARKSLSALNLLHSLRAQLAASSALLVLAIVAFSGIALTVQMDHRDRDSLDRELQDQLSLVSADVDQLLLDTNASTDALGNSLDSTSSVVRYISGSAVLAERGDLPTEEAPIPTENGFSTVTINGESWRSLVISPNPDSSDQLQILQDISPLEDRLESNRRLVAIVTIAAALLAGIAGWVVTSVVIEPLQRMRRNALAIRADGIPTERLPVMRYPQEVHDLTAAFNGVLQNLQTSTKSARRFTADAGRELRTPLNSLGLQLETLRRNPDLDPRQLHAMVQSMGVEHRRMVSLLDGLQKLARGDAGAVPSREYIDIAELLGFCVRDAQQRFPTIIFRLHPYEGAMAVVEGWADGLRLAIGNLLENAAVHGNPNGQVEIELYADARWIDINVSDDGPGIPADQREPLKERFARGANARNGGSGLGLALVVQQAKLHGGQLILTDAVGGGLSATLTVRAFPVSSTATVRSARRSRDRGRTLITKVATPGMDTQFGRAGNNYPNR